MAGASRVGEVRLRARLPATLAADADAVKARLEREVVVAVLEEVERRVHAALGPEVIVHLRHLALAWQLGLDELGDAAVHARLADELVRDLAAAVDAQSDDARLRPDDASMAVFVDEPHRVAAALADDADARPRHWSLVEQPAAPALWTATAASGAPALRATVAWLARMARVEVGLALADEPSLVAVVEAVPGVAGAVAVIRARRAARSGAIVPPREAEAPSSESPAARASRVDAHDVPPRDAMVAPPSDAGRSVEADPAAPITETRNVEAPRRVEDVTPSSAPRAAAEPPRSVVAAAASLDTSHAGLFFLVGRVLEIELAEQMWAAGIDEGRALVALARTLVDDPDDPSPAWFGGEFRDPSRPTVFACSPSAVAEVRAGVTHALGLRLVRFGIARTPAALDAELTALAAAWPAPPTLDPDARALVTYGAAAIALVTAARLQRAPGHALVRAVCQRPGALALSDDAVHVVLRSAALELDLRRAGLDHDPGYAPWLRRRVAIEYVGLDTL